jgi:hypothetical protein
VSGTGEDRDLRARQVEAERERIRAAFPEEYADGARRAFSGNKLYPRGFNGWPLDRRNAWFAGWNKGYVDRKKREGAGDGR